MRSTMMIKQEKKFTVQFKTRYIQIKRKKTTIHFIPSSLITSTRVGIDPIFNSIVITFKRTNTIFCCIALVPFAIDFLKTHGAFPIE